MEIRNLKTFLRVASLRSFTQAGEELGYSQANISAQIKQLETELGAPLFDRIGRQVFITPYGEALLRYAREIVSAEAEARTIARSAEDMIGTIRLGMAQSVYERIAETVLMRFHERFPNMCLELTVDATAALSESLSQGSLDLACLIDDAAPQRLRYLASFEAEIVVAAHPDHPFADAERVTLSDLHGQQMILMEESAPYTAQFMAALSSVQAQPRVFLELQSPAMALRLVERLRVLTLLPRYSVREASEQGRVRVVHLSGLQLRQSVLVASHPSKAMTPPIQGLAEELQTALQRL